MFKIFIIDLLCNIVRLFSQYIFTPERDLVLYAIKSNNVKHLVRLINEFNLNRMENDVDTEAINEIECIKACTLGHYECLIQLLNSGFKCTNNCLRKAVECNHIHCALLVMCNLQNTVINVPDYGRTVTVIDYAYYLATYYDRYDLIEYLHTANYMCTELTVYAACLRGRSKILRFLITKDINVDIEKCTQICTAKLFRLIHVNNHIFNGHYEKIINEYKECLHLIKGSHFIDFIREVNGK